VYRNIGRSQVNTIARCCQTQHQRAQLRRHMPQVTSHKSQVTSNMQWVTGSHLPEVVLLSSNEDSSLQISRALEVQVTSHKSYVTFPEGSAVGRLLAPAFLLRNSQSHILCS